MHFLLGLVAVLLLCIFVLLCLVYDTTRETLKFAAAAADHAASAEVHAQDAANTAEELAQHPALAVPAAGAPGVSLPQVLQYWDLLSKLIGYWAGFKGAAVGDIQTIAAIRTKINGRHVKLGPIPVEFES